ncbi:glycosyltransferase family 4 protein [Blautia sp. HCP3S3_C4]|uniref:glycosyltransferase family 4 protein n=1 Tax=Blautia sp. HCP3S3_C4 TaxID=3438911 RepID=UPI003F89613B
MKIALVTANTRPIPATCGGATQTMLTHLLDVNEVKKKHQFFVYSAYESEAEEKSYQYQASVFRYYHNSKVDFLCGLPYRIMRKLTFGKTYIKTNFIRWCVQKMKEDRPDVVVIEGNYFQTLQLKNALNIPLILHMHIDGLHTGTDNGKNIVSACKGIFVISDYCRKRVAQIDPAQSSKIHILKNTIDVAHFDASGRAEFRNEFREVHEIEERDIVFVYCGRLDEVKGVKEAIDAFSQLPDKNSYMLVIGSSAYKDGKKNAYVQQLEKQSEKLGRRVIFTGYVSQEDLPNYYASCDISLVPSKWQEAAGNVTIEALACGLPVIATKQGGIPEYADEAGCLLIDCDERLTEHLQEAMETLMQDKDLYQEKKENARSIALKYDKFHYYSNFCDLIEEVMS